MTPSSPISVIAKTKRQHALWIGALRGAWIVFALLTISVVVLGSVLRYSEQQQVCTAPLEVCFVGQRLTPSNLAGIPDPDGALQFHALFFLVVNGLVRVFCWLLALLLFWRRSEEPMALILGIYLLTVGNPGPLLYAAAAFPALQPFSLVNRMIGALCFGLFFCLFPNGHFAPRWTRWLALAWAINAVTAPFQIFPRGVPLWFVLSVQVPLYGISVLAQIVRYRKVSTLVERQQTKWVVLSIVFWLALYVGVRLSAISGPSLDAPISAAFYIVVIGFGLAVLALPFGLSLAILRYRLFDIDLIINRTLVYGVLTALIVGLYMLIVGGLGALFQTQGNLAISFGAAGVVAVVFQPLRERLQRGVNRLMYGERDEPYRVLTRLGQRLEAAIEPSAALPLTVETVAYALKLPYVAITLKQEEAFQSVAAYGASQNTLTRLPLIYASETIGELVAASRAPNEALSPADQRLLSDLARQIGVTAHAILLAADLERSRLRIVAAREEARRRLGSDLHDGVGHQLAGLAHRAEMAMNLLERDPMAARGLLAEVTQQLNAAIAQVRGLAHQLHPPELELLGLAGALRERAQTHTGLLIRIDAPEALPPLPTAIETAAYYIALEALTNVEKHAGARSCRLRLALVQGESAFHPPVLELDIADDGRGLPPEKTHGLGLLSMQARAAEVGGTCRIESSLGGGTRITVRLPCPLQIDDVC